MQAPTRNSNLISHPNKDKLAKNKGKDGNEDVSRAAKLSLQNKRDLITHQQQVE
jgi:hypothetical protein